MNSQELGALQHREVLNLGLAKYVANRLDITTFQQVGSSVITGRGTKSRPLPICV